MRKPILYALRALLTLEAAVAVVFTPTEKAIRLIPLLAAAWLAAEAVNAVRIKKQTAMRQHDSLNPESVD